MTANDPKISEGQEIEVLKIIGSCGNADVEYWRRARVVTKRTMEASGHDGLDCEYTVVFQNGTIEAFDRGHVRLISH